MECEERSKLLKKMVREGVGFGEEEQFFLHERGKLKGKKNNLKEERKSFLALFMGRKLKDNISLEKSLRNRRDQARRLLEDAIGANSTACRNIVKRSKAEGVKVRRGCEVKNMKKLTFLMSKYGMRYNGLSELSMEDREKYKNA